MWQGLQVCELVCVFPGRCCLTFLHSTLGQGSAVVTNASNPARYTTLLATTSSGCPGVEPLCSQPSLPGPSPAAAAAAAVAGLGGLLAANPAAATELLSNAGAFIPGIVGDDPVRWDVPPAVPRTAPLPSRRPRALAGSPLRHIATPAPVGAWRLPQRSRPPASSATPRREGFIQALLLIFFSEIGDKTFFIALLLALQQPKGLVFGGTFGALAVMTVISVGLGRFLHLLDEASRAGDGPSRAGVHCRRPACVTACGFRWSAALLAVAASSVLRRRLARP